MYAEGATEVKKEVERKEVVSGCCDERRVQQKDFWIAFVDGCGDGGCLLLMVLVKEE